MDNGEANHKPTVLSLWIEADESSRYGVGEWWGQ